MATLIKPGVDAALDPLNYVTTSKKNKKNEIAKKIVKKYIGGAKEAAGNYIYAAGLKRRQNKMITNYVQNSKTKLAPQDRSMNNVINEMEKKDASIKASLRKKGLYK